MGKNREPGKKKHIVDRQRSKVPEGRVLWAEVGSDAYVLYDHSKLPDEEGEDPEYEDGFTLFMRFNHSGRTVKLPLARLTGAELRTLKEFWIRAMDQAIPVADRLDKEAQEAYDNDGTDLFRLYRPVPRLFVRGGEESEHGSRIQGGPVRVPGVDGQPRGHRRADDDGESVHHRIPKDVGTEDHG